MTQSQNGWDAYTDYGDPNLVSNPTVPGTDVQVLGGLRAGDVATVLLWVAVQFNATVEPLVQAQGIWGFEPRLIRGSTEVSNHASGTAEDFNSALHPLGASGTFTTAQVNTIHGIIAQCDGVIRWGGDYTGRVDEMHFEINDTATAVAVVAAKLSGAPPALPVDTGFTAVEAAEINAYLDAKLAAVAASTATQYGAGRLIDGRFGLTDVVAAIAHKTGSIPPVKK